MRAAASALLATALLSLVAPGTARAEWQFTPFLGYSFKGSTTLLDTENAAGRSRLNFGGAVTLLGERPFGVEALFTYTGGFLQNAGGAPLEDIDLRVTSSRTYALMGNAVLTVPRAWSEYGLRPYVSGGVGRLHVARSDVRGTLPFRLNLLGMNAGGGAVGFVSDRIGLRFDLRYFQKIRGPDPEDLEIPPVPTREPIRLRYWTGTVGVVIRY